MQRYVPNLNREGVADWTGGNRNWISLGSQQKAPEFGIFTVAFRKLEFVVGKKDNCFYALDVKILEAAPVAPPEKPEPKKDDAVKLSKQATPMGLSDETWQKVLDKCSFSPPPNHRVGAESSIWLPTKRQGTATDPDKAQRDDRLFVEAVRALCKVAPGAPFNYVEAIDMLCDGGRVAHDNMVFQYHALPAGSVKLLEDPATGEVLRVTAQMNCNRRFRLVGEPAIV